MIRNLFGVDITDIDIASSVDMFLTGNHDNSGFFYVVTPNVDHFQRLECEPDSIFRQSYMKASFRFCDSRVIQKFSLLKGYKIENVIPGSDLTHALLSNPVMKTKKIMMLGPSNEEVGHIAKIFELNNVVSHSPPMGFIGDDVAVQKAIEAVANSGAEFTFIAVGSPQQEILALKIKEYSEANTCNINMVAFCIGASLDFLTGKQDRAPRALQKLHLEWLHRALTNPRKLAPRYFRNFLWLCKILLR